MKEPSTARCASSSASRSALSLAFVGPKTMWAYLGLVPLLTGVVGFCPAYALFGIRTCKLRS